MTLEEIKDRVAIEQGYESFNDFAQIMENNIGQGKIEGFNEGIEAALMRVFEVKYLVDFNEIEKLKKTHTK